MKSMTLKMNVPIEGMPHREYPHRLAKVFEDAIHLGTSPHSSEHYRLGDYLRIGEQGPFVRLWQLTAVDAKREEATIVSRTARYRAAETTAAFLVSRHNADGVQPLIDMFRSCGGLVINPGGLAQEDRDKNPALIGQINSGRSLIWFQRADDAEHHDAAVILAYLVVAYPPEEEYPTGPHPVDPVHLAATEWWPLLETSAAMIHSYATGDAGPMAARAWNALAEAKAATA